MSHELIIWTLIMLISLAVLVKSADYFTAYSEKAGVALGVSQFIIGATIVSLGTSMPELITSIIAVIQGHSEIVSGDVIGSNITNILLVVGLAALASGNSLYNRKLSENLDIPILVCITAILFISVRDGVFTLVEAIIMILAYIIYIAYLIHSHKSEKNLEARVKQTTKDIPKKKLHWHIPVIILISTIFIAISANWTVESVVKISQILNIGTAVVAGSVIAIGTSLPELVVSIQAARKKQAGMVLGNIFGSNIFNSTMVMGVSGLFGTLIIPDIMLSVGVVFLITATAFLVFSSLSKHISLFEGGLYLLVYFYFLKELIFS
ncbi:MAG: calcium/sodium antiporter [Patescibacteria group bacterium]|nr:calcium/sodium antiporter [Patescibacteria group bacterium]